MQFNEHWDLAGKHSVLSASSHSWLRYSKAKMHDVYVNDKAKEKGTELHAIASSLITNHIKVARLKNAFNLFVNDAIGFNMHSEKVLAYSQFAFGTADAISFKDSVLRIHDLKTGYIPVVKFEQLDIYAAYFCLEYKVDPLTLTIVERLYQEDHYTERIAPGYDIKDIMEKIVELDAVIGQTFIELNDQDF